METDAAPAAVLAGEETQDEETQDEEDEGDPDRIELRVACGHWIPEEGDLCVVGSATYEVNYALHVREILDWREADGGAVVLVLRGLKEPVYVNVHDPLVREEQARYKRRPTTIGRLCWNGYHQPQHAGHVNYMQCKGLQCRCFCHSVAHLSGFHEPSEYLARQRRIGERLAAGDIEALIAPDAGKTTTSTTKRRKRTRE
jgi:hypothetical protein